MKHVLLINGSPHAAGCTYTALKEVAGALESCGVSTELFQLGTGPVRGCIACGACKKLGRCAFDDDPANALAERAIAADGIVIGSPVYYAGPNGALCAVLDRAFFTAGKKLDGKPGAAVVSCRRGGASASFDRLNKYFTICNMPVVPSKYWNSVHGSCPEDVQQDLEGLQVMRTLGKNMAWMLNALPAAPERETPVQTNFIRR